VPPFFAVTTTVILESQQSDAVAWLGISTDDDKTVSAVSASSPAASAGVRRGDIIEAVDGAPVSSVDQVVRAIHRHRPGDVCVLTITRAKAHLTLRAVLGRLS
jgi:S1-C subfamily serine protease